MLLFAITGITLNHASIIPADYDVQEVSLQVPDQVLQKIAPPASETAPLPAVLRTWLAAHLSVHIAGATEGEWSDGELYLALPRPGGDAWLSLDLESGELFYERTSRGLIAYLNDLHKGRDTGLAWRWFIDLFAVACIVFSVTGLWLLMRHAGGRPGTWPAVALGLVMPVIVITLFVH